jgi:thiol:disulfide interchange protein DsbA
MHLMKILQSLVISLVILPVVALAESFKYEEGTHYVELRIPIKVRDPAKIEVAEYFSYGCPHCYQFEPLIQSWKAQLSSDVSFERTPAIWNRDYQIYAQTYYTAEALKVTEKVHGPLFDAIQNQRKRLNDPKEMAMFFSQFGVDPVDFAKVYKSFGVRAKLQQAEAKGRAYRSSGVPAVIVNGKYRVEGSMAGSNAEMLKVVNFLINKERQAKSL